MSPLLQDNIPFDRSKILDRRSRHCALPNQSYKHIHIAQADANLHIAISAKHFAASAWHPNIFFLSVTLLPDRPLPRPEGRRQAFYLLSRGMHSQLRSIFRRENTTCLVRMLTAMQHLPKDLVRQGVNVLRQCLSYRERRQG